MFEYVAATCLGGENVAKFIDEYSRKGFEPFMVEYCGRILPEQKPGSLQIRSSMVINGEPQFLVILRKPLIEGKS